MARVKFTQACTIAYGFNLLHFDEDAIVSDGEFVQFLLSDATLPIVELPDEGSEPVDDKTPTPRSRVKKD